MSFQCCLLFSRLRGRDWPRHRQLHCERLSLLVFNLFWLVTRNDPQHQMQSQIQDHSPPSSVTMSSNQFSHPSGKMSTHRTVTHDKHKNTRPPRVGRMFRCFLPPSDGSTRRSGESLPLEIRPHGRVLRHGGAEGQVVADALVASVVSKGSFHWRRIYVLHSLSTLLHDAA